MQKTINGNSRLKDFYHRHRQEYARIDKNLHDVRQKFLNANREAQRHILVNRAYPFAMISANTQLETFEKAYSLWVFTDNFKGSLKTAGCGYHNNRTEYYERTIVKHESINSVIDHLENREIDKAHRELVDNFLGLSYVKGAFTLCMLGFTEKMCIDTNVMQIAGIEKVEINGINSITDYEVACGEIMNSFNSELGGLSPFMVQWILFDYKRNLINAGKDRVTKHDCWFNSVLPELEA